MIVVSRPRSEMDLVYNLLKTGLYERKYLMRMPLKVLKALWWEYNFTHLGKQISFIGR